MPSENKYSHVIDYLCSVPWAIMPEFLDVMHGIIAARIENGEPFSMEELELKTGKSDGYSREVSIGDNDKTLSIPIYGPISKRMTLFQQISGGTSTEQVKRDIMLGLSDNKVDNILLDIDSPGGSADGPFELAEFIRSSRGKKPIRAFANGRMASAAYLIGSAADEIIATPTSVVGSIGVVMAHYDYSEMDKKEGVKRTFLTAGKYKAMGNDAEPLNKESREYLLGHLDELYTLFVDSVAKNRAVDTQTVLNDMAEGRIFIGKQALNIGLVDRLGTIDSALDFTEKGGGVKIGTVESTETIIYKGGDTDMTLAELREKYPELVKQLSGEVKASMSVEFERERSALKDSFETKLSDMSSRLESSDGRLRSMEKSDTIRGEREMGTRADNVMTKKLEASEIPSRLYPKVQGMVSYEKFIVDGKFDIDAYSKAADAEITDWEGRGVKTSVLGTGFASKDDVDAQAQSEAKTAEDDDKWVAEMQSFVKTG